MRYLLNLNVDGLFLEYDDNRSGDFEPLKSFKRDDQTVVLGLITSKFPELEDPDSIKDRIKEASQYIPLENLALSPQCGFSSTEEGNILTEEEQWNKISHMIKIAESVWGEQLITCKVLSINWKVPQKKSNVFIRRCSSIVE